MRVLMVVLVTASIVGAISLVYVGLDMVRQSQEEREVAPQQPTKQDSLPDSLRFADKAKLRDNLISSSLGGLDGIKTKYADDMLLGINCDVAKSRVMQDYGRANDNPLMLGASLMRRAEEPPVLAFHALNLSRETDRLVIVGRMPDGLPLRAVYHFGIQHKDPSLVAQRMTLVRKVPFDELKKLGEMKSVAFGSEVHLPFRSEILPIPDVSPIAAAVEDRSGRTSNFVAVFEGGGKPASDDKADAAQSTKKM